MSTRCAGGELHTSSTACNGCNLLAISAKTLPNSFLCSLSECPCCIDQAADSSMSSVKVALSKGSHDAFAIRMPRWKVSSLPSLYQAAAVWLFCCSVLWLLPHVSPGLGPRKGSFFALSKRNFAHKVQGSMLMSSSVSGMWKPCRLPSVLLAAKAVDILLRVREWHLLWQVGSYGRSSCQQYCCSAHGRFFTASFALP